MYVRTTMRQYLSILHTQTQAQHDGRLSPWPPGARGDANDCARAAPTYRGTTPPMAYKNVKNHRAMWNRIQIPPLTCTEQNSNPRVNRSKNQPSRRPDHEVAGSGSRRKMRSTQLDRPQVGGCLGGGHELERVYIYAPSSCAMASCSAADKHTTINRHRHQHARLLLPLREPAATPSAPRRHRRVARRRRRGPRQGRGERGRAGAHRRGRRAEAARRAGRGRLPPAHHGGAAAALGAGGGGRGRGRGAARRVAPRAGRHTGGRVERRRRGGEGDFGRINE
jgi:hypothetical protein